MARICLLLAWTLVFAGCTAATPTPSPDPITLRLATVPHLSRLAQDLTGEFSSEYSYVTFEVSVTASRDALSGVANRNFDIALVAEPAGRKRDTLEATTIGEQAVVVAVHPSNPIDTLTWGQVRDIFSGEVWDWATIDARWEPGEIAVVSQHAGAVSRAVFDRHVMENRSVTPRALVATGDEVAGQLIAQKPAAIGYLLAGVANDDVKALTVDGVKPDLSVVASTEWPVTRPVNLITHVDANVYVLDFLDFSTARSNR